MKTPGEGLSSRRSCSGVGFSRPPLGPRSRLRRSRLRPKTSVDDFRPSSTPFTPEAISPVPAPPSLFRMGR